MLTVKTETLTRYPLLLFIMGVFLAILGAMLVVIPTLDPPAKDMRLLVTFMTSTGVLTISLAYILYRLGLVSWFRSLRWSLLVTIILTVVLIFVNVWVTAQLMFITSHDLFLTTGLLVFAGMTAITFGYFISSALTDSIRDMAKATEQLASGDLTTRLDVRGNDELANLGKAFNWMASSLQQIDEQKRMLEQTRRDLIAWISHDLRTPLASMRVMIEAMTDGVVDDPATTARYLQNTQNEIQHLSRMIDSLFELAQLDTGQVNLNIQMASLRDLISDTLGSMNAHAKQQHIDLAGEVDDSVDPVYIAPDKIQRVLYNLVHNAILYTPPQQKITLTARSSGDDVRVDVHNSGAAIATDEIPHIFDSFYRGERSRTKNNTGHRGAGLGLAIARGFVEAHGGKIWVESSPDTGTTFSFTLPRQLKSATTA
jgi:signal transduction histidine kinase